MSLSAWLNCGCPCPCFPKSIAFPCLDMVPCAFRPAQILFYLSCPKKRYQGGGISSLRVQFTASSPAPSHWDQRMGSIPTWQTPIPTASLCLILQQGPRLGSGMCWVTLLAMGAQAVGFRGSCSGVQVGTHTTSPAEARMLQRFAWRQHP